jgi:hypothetical protein
MLVYVPIFHEEVDGVHWRHPGKLEGDTVIRSDVPFHTVAVHCDDDLGRFVFLVPDGSALRPGWEQKERDEVITTYPGLEF